jgi:sulfate permease, SulP family
MLIPQGMAYALLAGLPLYMGLYASMVPLIIYALQGTSRQLSLGPIAMGSLILGAGLNELTSNGQFSQEEIVPLAVIITLLAGMFQVCLSLLRLGGLVNLLSHPVVTGFTAAAALVIGASQLQHMIGFKTGSASGVIGTLEFIFDHLSLINYATLIVGCSALVLLRVLSKIVPNWPTALIVVFIGITASFVMDLQAMGVAIIGPIPPGLPSFETPSMLTPLLVSRESLIGSLKQLAPLIEQLGPLSLTIALIAFMESISAAKVYARQNRYAISPSQELWSNGLANVGSAFFGGYIVGGALSRTAVNAKAGAKSPVANIVTAGVVAIALAIATPVFAFLPKPILAAIILNAVAGLVDVKEVVHLWHIKKDDLVLLIITFLVTLFVNIDTGILVGIGSSLMWLVFTTTRPNVTSLGKLPGTTSYRSTAHFPSAVTFDRILIVRMEAQFFFGNVTYLKDSLYTRLTEFEDPCALVLDASSINALDSTAVDTLMEIIQALRRQGVEVMMSHVKGSVLDVMSKSGVTEELGTGHLFYEVEDAVNAALRHRDAVEAGIACEDESFGPSDAMD